MAAKTKKAVATGLSVIFCIGETLEEREKGETIKVVEKQLEAARGALTKEDWEKIVVAYEPVWAIGTGNSIWKEVHQRLK